MTWETGWYQLSMSPSTSSTQNCDIGSQLCQCQFNISYLLSKPAYFGIRSYVLELHRHTPIIRRRVDGKMSCLTCYKSEIFWNRTTHSLRDTEMNDGIFTKLHMDIHKENGVTSNGIHKSSVNCLGKNKRKNEGFGVVIPLYRRNNSRV
jgi:hypothetical protein